MKVDLVLDPGAEGLVDGLVEVEQDGRGQTGRDLAVLHQLVKRILRNHKNSLSALLDWFHFRGTTSVSRKAIFNLRSIYGSSNFGS